MVVDLAPVIEEELPTRYGSCRLIAQHFSLQGAMKPFVFTLGLRMMRSGIGDPNAEPHQPDTELSVMTTTTRAPRRPVVTSDPIGQTVKTKDVNQKRLNNEQRIARTSLQGHGKARVIIENRQGITTASRQLEITFEVHLPELIGPRFFVALKGFVFACFVRVEQIVTLEYRLTRTRRW